jgi:hypothetical protein
MAAANFNEFMRDITAPNRLMFKYMCEFMRDVQKYSSHKLKEEQLYCLKQFFQLIPETNCFVLRDRNLLSKEKTLLPEPEAWEDVALPFKTCSFEMFDKEKGAIVDLHFPSGQVRYCVCLWVHEESPEKYIFIAISFTKDGKYGPAFEIVKKDDNKGGAFTGFVNLICNKLKHTGLGKENRSFYIKRGFGSAQNTTKPKQIIHVVPKKEKEEYAGIGGAPIDWSHRWEVRGHWRKQDGIGKDRAGEYQVRGWTWVVPHTKGPEDKLLVKKIRIVENIVGPSSAELS